MVTEKLAITADFQIHKIKDRVFQIGFLDPLILSNYSCIFNIVNLGFKFIPSIFNNRISFFSFFSYFFEELISNLNKNLFFIKQNSYKNVDKVKQDLNPFEVIIRKLRNNNFKTKKFPLQYESIEFEYEFYKEFMNLKFNNFQNNISITDFYKIKDFIKKKPFKILNCDKNIGSAIISH